MVNFTEQELKQEVLTAAKEGRLGYLNALMGVKPVIAKLLRGTIRSKNRVSDQTNFYQKSFQVLAAIINARSGIPDAPLSEEHQQELFRLYRTGMQAQLNDTSEVRALTEDPQRLIARVLQGPLISKEDIIAVINLVFPTDSMALSGSSLYWMKSDPKILQTLRREHWETLIRKEEELLALRLKDVHTYTGATDTLIKHKNEVHSRLEPASAQRLTQLENDAMEQVVDTINIYRRVTADWLFSKTKSVSGAPTGTPSVALANEPVVESRDRADTKASEQSTGSAKSRGELEELTPLLKEKTGSAITRGEPFSLLENLTMVGSTKNKKNEDCYSFAPGVSGLMSANVSVDTCDENRVTLLAHAVERRDYDMARVLLDGDADMEFADINGKTPRQRAIETEDPLMMGLFAIRQDLVLSWPYLPEIATFMRSMGETPAAYAQTLELSAAKYIADRYMEERASTRTLWDQIADLFHNKEIRADHRNVAERWVKAAQKSRLDGNYDALHALVESSLSTARMSVRPRSYSRLYGPAIQSQQDYQQYPESTRQESAVIARMKEQVVAASERENLLQARVDEVEKRNRDLLEKQEKDRAKLEQQETKIEQQDLKLEQQKSNLERVEKSEQALLLRMQKLESFVNLFMSQQSSVSSEAAPIAVDTAAAASASAEQRPAAAPPVDEPLAPSPVVT